MTSGDDLPTPVLKPGALYWGDNQRLICAKCAGFTALCTGHDTSDQRVRRVTAGDVEVWLADRDSMSCEAGCTTLDDREGPDGWPEVPRSPRDGGAK